MGCQLLRPPCRGTSGGNQGRPCSPALAQDHSPQGQGGLGDEEGKLSFPQVPASRALQPFTPLVAKSPQVGPRRKCLVCLRTPAGQHRPGAGGPASCLGPGPAAWIPRGDRLAEKSLVAGADQPAQSGPGRTPRQDETGSKAPYLPLPLSDRCGWLLTALGAPWVAQRVCAMPKWVSNSTSKSMLSCSRGKKSPVATLTKQALTRLCYAEAATAGRQVSTSRRDRALAPPPGFLPDPCCWLLSAYQS